MYNTQLIYAVVELERRLEFEEEKRKSRRPETRRETPAEPQPCLEEVIAKTKATCGDCLERRTVSPCS